MATSDVTLRTALRTRTSPRPRGRMSRAKGDLPILGICGWSGSGKTTLIEQILPPLCAKGLRVAVVKHDAHGIQIDRPGKDSDRFYQAGADVFLRDPKQDFLRRHLAAAQDPITDLDRMCLEYDLLLIEGYKHSPIPKLWLASPNEAAPPDDDWIIQTLPRDSARAATTMSFLREWMPHQCLKTPVFACVLIGGNSRRMGQPKHLIRKNGKTWLESTVQILGEVTENVIISGAGDVPDGLKGHLRLPDIPEVNGPMAGVLSAMRWAPRVSWLVVACDLPNLTTDAVSWLLSTRRPGVWATLPRLAGSPGVEPLLAHYDFRARAALEEAAGRGDFQLATIISMPAVATPTLPASITPAWCNVNKMPNP
jgi:molybdopterin-guanine dinucleotide biosynthesis protein MobB